ncbi:MAG: alpha-L-rhamnosidase, partial [Bacteroidetes bacterium]|nr:alpha-L-rhamnosidase [Bacteroidota bacterium]
MKSFIILFTTSILACTIFASGCTSSEGTLLAEGLKTEYKENPYLDVKSPRFSWYLVDEQRGQEQTAYQILVASSPELLEEGKADVWDTKKISSDRMSQVEFKGKELKKKTRYYWKVRCWDRDGNSGPFSTAHWFETGLMEAKNWEANWIGYDLTQLGKEGKYHLPPAPYFRKELELKGAVKKATLYATALGVYDFFINGRKVGVDYLNPGWTNYNKRLHYQAFDVTAFLDEGVNAFGSVLSYGWYSGYLGYALLVGLPQVKNFYGEVPLLMAQLELEYEDGSKEILVTDKSWKASSGPLLESDLLQGESYDARRELGGWDSSGYDDSGWDQVQEYDSPDIAIALHPGMPIREIERITPVGITPRKEGTIFNLGQNFAG